MVLAAIQTTRQRTHAKMAGRTRQVRGGCLQDNHDMYQLGTAAAHSYHAAVGYATLSSGLHWLCSTFPVGAALLMFQPFESMSAWSAGVCLSHIACDC
jgi:hypothetical protein